MGDKELLFAALRGEETPRPALVPFVGVHGGSLIGVSADEYLKSPDNIVAGQTKAAEMYNADGIPVVFDLQMEAEVLGCDLQWAEKSPPSVVSHPLAVDLDAWTNLPKFDTTQGRFPIVAEVTQRLRKSIGDDVALYGLITGPFTLASHLRSSLLMMDFCERPDGAQILLNYCASVAKKTAAFYVELGIDVLAVVDPMTSQIGSGQFTQFVSPALSDLFEYLHSTGTLSSLFVCGQATHNLEAMCQVGCDNVSIDENIPLEKLRQYASSNRISFGGNMKLVSVLLMGSLDDTKRHAIECINVGGKKAFVLAPGCDLPYDANPENLAAVAEVLYLVEQERSKVYARLATAVAEDYSDVVIPNYGENPYVTLDVVTQDPGACAACYYMMEAVRSAASQFDGNVRVEEHRLVANYHDAAGYLHNLKGEGVPVLFIDGKQYSTTTPSVPKLAQAIQTVSDAKHLT